MDSNSDELETAAGRLNGALDALEAALSRRRRQTASAESLAVEVETLAQDRSRLAQELDQARARVARLESAGDHAAERIDSAIGSIRHLLDRQKSPVR